MKITSLHLKNFRGVEDLKLDFPTDEPIAITGPNGSGKTSVLGAIQWALTGGIVTDQKTKRDLLRTGAHKGFVALGLDDFGTIKRWIDPHKIKMPGLKNPTIGDAQYEICNQIGCRKKELELCLRTDLFVASRDQDQRDLLYEILRIRITEETVEKYLEDEKLREAYLKHLDESEVSDDLDSAYSEFYTARTGVNRQLKTVKASLQKHQDEKPEDVLRRRPDKLPFGPEEYDKKRTRIEELSRVLGRVQNAKAQKEKRQARIRDLQALLERAYTEQEHQKAVEVMESLKASIRRKSEDIPNVKQLEASLRSLRGDQCPTCKRDWEDLDQRKSQRAEIESQIAEAKKAREALRGDEERLEKGQAWFRAYEEQQRQQAELETLLKEEQEPAPNVGEVEGELEELRRTVKGYEEARELCREASEWTRRETNLQREIEELESDVSELNRLVNLFDSNGIKFRVFKEGCDGIAAGLNAITSPWGMAVRFGEILQIEINRGDCWRDLAGASDGEKILFALALQIWLADFSGVRLAILDRIESLDPLHQAELFNALSTSLEAGHIDQAIVLGCRIDDGASNYCTVINLDAVTKRNEEK